MIKHFLTLAFGTLLLLNSACSQKSNTKQGTAGQEISKPVVELLSPEDFSARMKSNPGVLIDVRTPQETKKGIIEGALLLNLFSDEFEAEIDKMDKEKTYYVYCAAGGRSAETAELMEKKGFKHVVDLDGGFTKWQSKNLPTIMP